ncbi:MAG: hypothetical protein ACOX5S_03610 [Patescibacteria group bacterium]|jgi:hypothetical protein
MSEGGISPEINEKEIEPIELLARRLDERVGKKEGISISQTWEYRERVRAKYQLPECAGRWENPVGYIDKITKFAKEKGIPIRPKDEFQPFFEKYKNAKAAIIDNNLVVEKASGSDWFALRALANQLSHEIVHGLQNQKYPRMSDEEAEREAFYYQMITPDTIRRYKDNPEFLHHFINKIVEADIKTSCANDQAIREEQSPPANNNQEEE